MIDYPNDLDKIFDKLKLFKIKSIIVGGYIRDRLLNLDSKDIDVELYNLDSLELLNDILSEFGSLCSVGKSFGVYKLRYKNLDIDFSLPRLDSKVGSGHRGFVITTDKNLEFKTASRRRDFTINAMGFDVDTKTLLDPYNGLDDLAAKTLRAVDIEKFGEDPLRVLRAVQFSSRFDFVLESTLFAKCKEMIALGQLEELPSERVFEEFKKMILESKKPSHGFLLLKKLYALPFFKGLDTLDERVFLQTVEALDFLNSFEMQKHKKHLTLLLALLCREFSQEEFPRFLYRLTQEVKLHRDIKDILKIYRQFQLSECSNYRLYSLAEAFEIKSFLLFLDAAYLGKKREEIQSCRVKAKQLNIYTSSMPPLIQGRDLISFGCRPSQEFSQLLKQIYEAQKREIFHTKEEAADWVKENLLS